MALQAIIDSVDGLPDPIKAEYKPGSGDTEGKFVLDVSPVNGFSLGKNEGLYNALESERKISKELKQKLAAFNIDGEELTPEQAIEAIKKLKNFNPEDKAAVRKELEDQLKSSFSQKEKELVEKYENEIQTRSQKEEKLRNQLHQQLVVSKATEALSKKAPDAVDLLLPHVQSRVKVEDREDGELGVIVLNDEGGTRLSSASGNNNPMSIAEYVDEMAKDPKYATVFSGSNQRGSGSKGGAGGKHNSNDFGELTGAAKLKAARAAQDG